jgi:hypothetical protein
LQACFAHKKNHPIFFQKKLIFREKTGVFFILSKYREHRVSSYAQATVGGVVQPSSLRSRFEEAPEGIPVFIAFY